MSKNLARPLHPVCDDGKVGGWKWWECHFVLFNSHISAYAMCFAQKVCGPVRSTWGTSRGGGKLGARVGYLIQRQRAGQTFPLQPKTFFGGSKTSAPLGGAGGGVDPPHLPPSKRSPAAPPPPPPAPSTVGQHPYLPPPGPGPAAGCQSSGRGGDQDRRRHRVREPGDHGPSGVALRRAAPQERPGPDGGALRGPARRGSCRGTSKR